MSHDDVRDMVAAAIREHEARVALWSGLAGAVLMAGTWHRYLDVSIVPALSAAGSSPPGAPRHSPAPSGGPPDREAHHLLDE